MTTEKPLNLNILSMVKRSQARPRAAYGFIALSLVIVILAGCATPSPPKPTSAPQPQIPTITWQWVDEDLLAVSRDARSEAQDFAVGLLDSWLKRVRKLTDTRFVPWYTGFGTHQWLSIKRGWYGLSGSDDGRSPEEQTAAYLQEQYYEQVLEPASRGLGPHTIADVAAERYLHTMADSIRQIPGRYALPSDRLEERLERIPAIHVAGNPPQRASLQELITVAEPGEVPAYKALVAQLQPMPGDSAQAWQRFGPLTADDANARSEQFALRGGASLAALALGGVAGALISVGVSGWQAFEHEKKRPELERALRTSLAKALDELHARLLNDPNRSLMAIVDHIADKVESGLLSAEMDATLDHDGEHVF